MLDQMPTRPQADTGLYLATMLTFAGVALMIVAMVVIARHEMTLPLMVMALMAGCLACALCRAGVRLAWHVVMRADGTS